MRADGFTEEQAKAWCQCDLSPHSTGPDELCALHGRYDAVWEVAYLNDGRLAVLDGYSSENYNPSDYESKRESLTQAEFRLADLRPEYEGIQLFLTCRLVLPAGLLAEAWTQEERREFEQQRDRQHRA